MGGCEPGSGTCKSSLIGCQFFFLQTHIFFCKHPSAWAWLSQQTKGARTLDMELSRQHTWPLLRSQGIFFLLGRDVTAFHPRNDLVYNFYTWGIWYYCTACTRELNRRMYTWSMCSTFAAASLPMQQLDFLFFIFLYLNLIGVWKWWVHSNSVFIFDEAAVCGGYVHLYRCTVNSCILLGLTFNDVYTQFSLNNQPVLCVCIVSMISLLARWRCLLFAIHSCQRHSVLTSQRR